MPLAGISYIFCVAIFVALLYPTSRIKAAELDPWSERAIRAHVDQEDLVGRLPELVFNELRRRGEELFTARFTSLDGAGRPLATQSQTPTRRNDPSTGTYDRNNGPDASGCSGCHNQPVPGGAGDFASNAFFADQENLHTAISPDSAQANERGTPHLFGAGLIELLAREMTAELHQIREQTIGLARTTKQRQSMPLEAKGVSFGTLVVTPDGKIDTSSVAGVDEDLIIRPFGHKGNFLSLRQFTIATLNHHHGMQADERFGFQHTGELDFDGDGISAEISAGDVSALVAWQAGLPLPQAVTPENAAWKNAAEAGRQSFDKFGCSTCHRPALPLQSLDLVDPGPVGAPGTLTAGVTNPVIYDLALLAWSEKLERDDEGRIMIPLFGDLKRHRIADSEGDALGNEPVVQAGIGTGVFITSELWGVGSTAPYGHRNDVTTLDKIIRLHRADGKIASDAYAAASDEERQNIIAFLKTLVIVPQ